jgi:hypothetical protein
MFTEQYFGVADIASVTAEDLLNFFSTEKQESDKLEFKSYKDVEGNGTKNQRDKAKLDALIQSVCGFLNSDGGLLIWGAPEGRRSDDESVKEKIFTGSLTGVSLSLEKDQVIGKISDSISPVPLRIRFAKVNLSADTYCYIFDVAKSDFSPHQFKGTYYMRVDGSTRPAPHHYVEALMKKVSYPRLQAGIAFGNTRQQPEYLSLPITINVHNLSKSIHDKNMRYRLMSFGGGLRKWGHRPYEFQLDITRDSDINSDVRDIIHYNMPTIDRYHFVARRIAGMQTLSAIVSLMVWADLSPVIICKYDLQFRYDPQSAKIEYTLQKDENSYLFERGNENIESEADGILRTNQFHLEQFEKEIIEQPESTDFLRNK